MNTPPFWSEIAARLAILAGALDWRECARLLAAAGYHDAAIAEGLRAQQQEAGR